MELVACSTTKRTPSTVSEVSAKFVEITIFRRSPMRRFANALIWRSFGSVEIKGNTWPR